MSAKKTNAELMAALRQDMAADVPPVLATMKAMAELPAPTPPPPAAVPSPVPAPAARPRQPRAAAGPDRTAPDLVDVDVAGGRTGINLSGPAVAALRRLQAFIITECGGSAASASAAVCMALEHAAAGLPDNKGQLAALYDANRQADKRRRPA